MIEGKAKMLERELQGHIKDAIILNTGFWPYIVNVSGRFSFKAGKFVPDIVDVGLADILVQGPDQRHFMIEVKRPGNKQSESQVVFEQRYARERNGRYVVACTCIEALAYCQEIREEWGIEDRKLDNWLSQA